jgi:hypothetical protein
MLLLTAGRLRPAEGNRQEHLAQTGRVSLHLKKKGAAGGGKNVTCAHLQIRFLALHVSDSLQNKSKAGTALITLVMRFCLLRTQTKAHCVANTKENHRHLQVVQLKKTPSKK